MHNVREFIYLFVGYGTNIYSKVYTYIYNNNNKSLISKKEQPMSNKTFIWVKTKLNMINL